jgi:4'-phosphopantetheinyl transferase
MFLRQRRGDAQRSIDMGSFMDIANARFDLKQSPKLAADEIHLWRVNLEAVAGEEPANERWSALLSEDEQARAARFHFARHRQYFTATRAILRRVLAAYLHTDAKALAFAYGAKNKPMLGAEYASSALAFNVSHSGDMALFAFVRSRQVGVDVERIRCDFDTSAIARRFFSAPEQSQLAALDPEQRHQAFFRCWTRKEAYIKAIGEGLSLPLDQFDVSLKQNDHNALLATRPDQTEAKRWSLRDVAAGPGYAAALCVSGADWKLIDWNTDGDGPRNG